MKIFKGYLILGCTVDESLREIIVRNEYSRRKHIFHTSAVHGFSRDTVPLSIYVQHVNSGKASCKIYCVSFTNQCVSF